MKPFPVMWENLWKWENTETLLCADVHTANHQDVLEVTHCVW